MAAPEEFGELPRSPVADGESARHSGHPIQQGKSPQLRHRDRKLSRRRLLQGHVRPSCRRRHKPIQRGRAAQQSPQPHSSQSPPNGRHISATVRPWLVMACDPISLQRVDCVEKLRRDRKGGRLGARRRGTFFTPPKNAPQWPPVPRTEGRHFHAKARRTSSKYCRGLFQHNRSLANVQCAAPLGPSSACTRSPAMA